MSGTEADPSGVPGRSLVEARVRALARRPVDPLPVDAGAPLVLRRAAVLVLVHGAVDDHDAYVVITRRAPHLRSHPGDLVFPGGGCEPDEIAEQAALREAQEEIGLDPRRVEVLGRFDDLWSASGWRITPVVAWSPTWPELRRDLAADVAAGDRSGEVDVRDEADVCGEVAASDEVDAVFHLPLREVFDPRRHRVVEVPLGPMCCRDDEYDTRAGTVVGVTGDVLADLGALVRGIERRRHAERLAALRAWVAARRRVGLT